MRPSFIVLCPMGPWPFTKLPLLQESRLTDGGSPNLMVLVEWKVPVEILMGAANSFHWFHPWLYTCTVHTADLNWFWLLLLRLYSVQGFPLYEDADLRRATTHQLYCFAIEIGFGANGLASSLVNKQVALHCFTWTALFILLLWAFLQNRSFKWFPFFCGSGDKPRR